MDNFVHLHVHSHYSLLDGKGKPAEYAERAAALGQPALAITDHGSLSGAYQHWKECNRVGIKPIIGCEFYVAPTSRKDRTPIPGFGGSGKHAHLTVIATGSRGLRNLFKLQARAYSEGLYGRPRIDFELLDEHREGLLVLSGCAGSHISHYLRSGQLEQAEELACRLKESFPGRFFIEVMHHDIQAEDLDESLLNDALIELASRQNIPLVATNDAHYCLEEDSVVHEALLCIQTKSTLKSEKRFKFDGHGYHIRSRAEMEELPLPRAALDTTVYIADLVESYDEVFAHSLRMPSFSDDEGYDLDSNATSGLIERNGVQSYETQPYWDRLNYELEVITSMGYAGYFLVLEHIIREAKKRGIVIGPGRGSAGGSLVAYALGITDLDPLAHGLLFERFLNPSRVSLPDIDIDVAENDRPSLIELIRELYGAENVSVIGNFGTIGAKAALKDANRVLGGNFGAGSEYVSHLPPAKFGRSPGLDKYTGPKDEVFSLACGLEGLIRNQGQHAAGVIISPEPLAGLVPLWRPADQEQLVCGFDMHELEALGLVKMDFLGLRNLGVINDCMRLLRNSGSTDLSLPILPEACNDQRTYELLSRGESLGVFQLDSPGMRGLLRLLRPTEFDDISSVLALYRPGPMGANAHVEFANRKNRNGGRWDSSWAIHAELEEALKPVVESTYGLIVFQEQVLAALNVVCGWSYAEAGLLFDAMRKKKHDKMQETKPSYLESGAKKGYSPEALEALWDTLVPFADYSFNRAHTAGYGLIAYWTAFLKANYPAEYMSSLLSTVTDDPDRLQEYLEECVRLGLKVMPPDINVSGAGFTPVDGGIRFGLAAISGVGEKAFEAIESCRPYRDLRDFLDRAPMTALNSGVVAALAKSGALDSVTANREAVVATADTVVTLAGLKRDAAALGQPLLVDTGYVPSVGVVNVNLRRGWELDTTGIGFSVARVIITPTRPLSELEFEFLRKMLDAHGGSQPVDLDLGRVVLRDIGRVDLTEKLKRAVESLPGVTIE